MECGSGSTHRLLLLLQNTGAYLSGPPRLLYFSADAEEDKYTFVAAIVTCLIWWPKHVYGTIIRYASGNNPSLSSEAYACAQRQSHPAPKAKRH